ncbi:MAG: hypothetical protein GDA49_00800 [Rhodospirillales bacterium]|nr:hypothetical protein [Rhodospirillales bacterium]
MRKKFRLADDSLLHLYGLIDLIDDELIKRNYLGFISVSAVTACELAIKEIFYEFGDDESELLGTVTRNIFHKINGRIAPNHLYNHISCFGKKYVDIFKERLRSTNEKTLQESGVNIIESYKSLVDCRNRFVHEGEILDTITYDELKRSYDSGKSVVHCLSDSMVR